MLPVALEVLSVHASSPGRKAGAPSDPDSPSPFAAMLDATSNDAPSQEESASSPASPAGTGSNTIDVLLAANPEAVAAAASPTPPAPATSTDSEIAPSDAAGEPANAAEPDLSALSVTGQSAARATPTADTKVVSDTENEEDREASDDLSDIVDPSATVEAAAIPVAPVVQESPAAPKDETGSAVSALAVDGTPPAVMPKVDAEDTATVADKIEKSGQPVTKTEAASTPPSPAPTTDKAEPSQPNQLQPADHQGKQKADPQLAQPVTKANPAETSEVAKPHPASREISQSREGTPALKAALDQPQPLPILQTTPAAAPDRATPAAQTPQAVAIPVEGVAVAIASRALEGKKSFEIRLDPPELGHIHVRLDVDRNGEITSRVMTDRQDTLDLLRRDAPALERALQDAGLKTANNGLQFSLRDHGSGQQGRPMPVIEQARLVVADETLALETTAPVYRAFAGNRAGLDIRV